MSLGANQRLTFNLKPHPDLEAARRGGREVELVGELKIAGTFPIRSDLNHGDELIVTIAGADGEAIARGVCTIAGPPPLIPIEVKDLGLVGYVRAHKAKVSSAEALE